MYTKLRRLLWLICLSLTACTVGIVDQKVLTPEVVTQTPIPMATGTPQPTSTVVPLTAPVPSLTPTPPPTHQPTVLPSSPRPTSAAPTVADLRGPMIVDSEAGRLYVTGRVNGVRQIVALAATDGQLLTTYNLTGTFAVDTVHDRLYVDQGEIGLMVLDAQTGAVLTNIPLPNSNSPAPQADPATGHVLAFRDNIVYVIDPDLGAVVDTISFDLPHSSCGEPSGPSPIAWADYDGAHRLLYVNFWTYNCTPWSGNTLVSYDLNTGTELTQHDMELYTAVAFDGYLYGSGRRGLAFYGVPETYSRWSWRDGRPWSVSEDWHEYKVDLCVDSTRGRLYESGVDFRVFDAETMTLLMSVPRPVEGQLVGYDSETDQLYFLADGQLRTWPASAIQPPSPIPLQVSTPAGRPVQGLWVSSAWPQDRTCFGLWDWTDAGGSLFYLSKDGGGMWRQPQFQGALRDAPVFLSALAVSPDYAGDQTILAGVVGVGIFKTTDGGQSWQPSSAGLSSMYASQILLSPGFGYDQTAFVLTARDALHRSTDGGITWRALDVMLDLVAMSPEFDQDQTLMGISDHTKVLITRDAGDSWERVGDMQDGAIVSMLSIAPLFSKWQVVFAYADDSLYRSVDGGHSWTQVLSPGPSSYGLPPQIVYGPETGEGRVLFLQVTVRDSSTDLVWPPGFLYYSEDAVNWWTVELPDGISPTAVAISPAFAKDGLLFVGDADGRVISLDTAALIEGL